MDPLSKFTDRELFVRLVREYEPRVVRGYTETVTTVTKNGNTTSSRHIENERIEFGSPMDLYTKYAEFDKEGRMVILGQSGNRNY
jgi:hypothetical protein